MSERKVEAEQAPIKYAEDAEFLTPVLRLLKAYINLIIHQSALNRANNWVELDNLWEIVAECQKRLPHNVKQEYFDYDKQFFDYLKPFNGVPVNFNCEPNRESCVYLNGNPLNLDNIGLGTKYGLDKHQHTPRRVLVGFIGDVVMNLVSITPYFELRMNGRTGLKYIIQQLEKRETAEALVVEYAKNGKALKRV